MTTETGVMWSQVKEGPQPRKRILPQSPGKERGPATPGFQTSGLQKAERVSISAVLSHEACGTLLQQPQETNILGYLLLNLINPFKLALHAYGSEFLKGKGHMLKRKPPSFLCP